MRGLSALALALAQGVGAGVGRPTPREVHWNRTILVGRHHKTGTLVPPRELLGHWNHTILVGTHHKTGTLLLAQAKSALARPNR